MTQQEINEVVEWMYVNDGKFSDKSEWRRAFIAMLLEKFKASCPIITKNYKNFIPLTPILPGQVTYVPDNLSNLQAES